MKFMSVSLLPYLYNLIKSSFFKNIFIVMSGTIGAQIIGFSLSPVISRLFSPEDFGSYGAFNSIVAIVGAFITFQLCQAIMLPKKELDAIHVFLAACIASLFVVAIFTIIILLTPNKFLNLFKTNNWLFIPFFLVVILATGLSQNTKALLIRLKAFKSTSFTHIVGSIITNFAKILTGYHKAGSIGLVFGTTAGLFISTLYLVNMCLKNVKKHTNNIKIKKIWQSVVEYKDFLFYSTPQNVMNALSQGMPVLLLTYFYDLRIAGSYAFATKIVQAPFGVILNSLRQVLFQKACEVYNQGTGLFSLFAKTTISLILLFIFPAMIIFYWVPTIFTRLFGEDWHTAGYFSRWLILWLAVAACNVPAVLFARILRLQRKMLFYEVIMLFLRTATLVIGGYFYSSLITISLFAIVGIILNCFLIVWIGFSCYKSKGKAFDTVL